MIHHLCWAVVAVAWLMAIGGPLALVPNRESSPQNPAIVTAFDELSEQRLPNTAEDFTRPAVQATSFRGDPGKAGTTAVNSVDAHDGRSLNVEETHQFVNPMQRVPQGARGKQDWTDILRFW